MRRKASKADLAAQSAELKELRGDRSQKEWAEEGLGVPVRTYIRYETGERRAPEAVLRLARISAKPAKPAKKK